MTLTINGFIKLQALLMYLTFYFLFVLLHKGGVIICLNVLEWSYIVIFETLFTEFTQGSSQSMRRYINSVKL